MTTREMTAVEFECVIDARLALIVVPAAQIAEHHATHGGWVKRVQFADGFWAWGKSWIANRRLRDGTPNPKAGQIVRVGAGAYGDVTVWEAA